MLADNIKSLRKQRGYSQETLANQLNVVRQTVSKWEKGLSVPDAEMLERLAETFEVPVGQLLGEAIPASGEQSQSAEIARQLAILNDYFARQAARRRRGWRLLLTVAGALLLLILLLTFLFGIRLRPGPELNSVTEALSHVGMWCELEGETYYYEISFNDDGEIRTGGGDAFVEESVRTDKYGDASELMEQVEQYFTSRGGDVEFVGDVP